MQKTPDIEVLNPWEYNLGLGVCYTVVHQLHRRMSHEFFELPVQKEINSAVPTSGCDELSSRPGTGKHLQTVKCHFSKISCQGPCKRSWIVQVSLIQSLKGFKSKTRVFLRTKKLHLWSVITALPHGLLSRVQIRLTSPTIRQANSLRLVSQSTNKRVSVCIAVRVLWGEP